MTRVATRAAASLTLAIALACALPALANATSVGAPSVSITSQAAGATNVTYLVTFTATHALAANSGTITVSAPSGTVFTTNGIDVYDLTSAADLGGTSGATLSNGDATATWTVGNGVTAGHKIRLTIAGVTNPAAATADKLAVSTSADTTAIDTGSYAITAPNAPGAPAVSLTSPAAGAQNITYLVTFTTSATGALAGNEGSITIAAPAGTVFSDNGIDVFDLTGSHSLGGTSGATLSNGGATATWTVGNAIPAGHKIQLSIAGVTNPAAATADKLTISTSSDTVGAQTAAYSITPAKAVSSVALVATSLAAGASQLQYEVRYTASSTGALVGGEGTITIAAPDGTVLSDNGIGVFDLTDGHDLGGTSGPTLSNGGATATWTVGNSIPAGHRIQLTMAPITNPGAGSADHLTISTSSDTVTADSATYPVTAAHALKVDSVSLLSTAAGALSTLYLHVTPSSTGRLFGSGYGAITIAAPSGTVFSTTAGEPSVWDATTGTSLGHLFEPTVSNGGATATFGVKEDMWPPGDVIELTIPGVTNPAQAAGYTMTVSTTSDTVPTTSPAYSTTAAKAVASPTVTLNSPAAKAIGITYVVDFTTSSSGALFDNLGTISVAAPSGTVIPNQGIDVFDLTTDTDLGGTYAPTLTNNGANATWTVGNGLAAGHRYQLTITGVENPAAATSDKLSISTSSDTVVANTADYAITAPKSVSSPSVSLSDAAAGATSTYTVTMTTSSTGELFDGNGTITVVAPSGTVIPNQGIDVFDLTTDTDLGGTYGPTLTNNGATATWTVGNGVPANNQIELIITGVVNPTAGSSYHLSVSTSSDSVASSTPAYTIS